MRSPFSLYIQQNKSGKVWYARFHDLETGKIYSTKSTGIPCTGKKGNKIKAFKKAELLLEKLQEEKEPFFIPYLESFWKPDSKYIQIKLLTEKKKISNYYIELNQAGIKHHVIDFKPFQNVRLSDLKPGLIEDWKLWAIKKGTGSVRLNSVLSSMKVACNFAYSRGDISSNPFQGVKKVIIEQKEKGVITQQEIKSIIECTDSDKRVKLSILLAMLCGLRRGEARGLLWKDIDFENQLIHVRHNYVDTEGLKGCKTGSDRQVFLPCQIIPLLKDIYSISPYRSSEAFILFHLDSDKKPINNSTIRIGFRRILETAGISKQNQRDRNLTYHGLRHTFVTQARIAGIPDIIVQALAGHKSADMMNHYSHAGQVIDFESARKSMGFLLDKGAV